MLAPRSSMRTDHYALRAQDLRNPIPSWDFPSGANDYVTKPFRLGRKLVARLRARFAPARRSKRRRGLSQSAQITQLASWTSAKIDAGRRKGPKSSMVDRKRNIHLEIPSTGRGQKVVNREMVAVGSVFPVTILGVTTHTLETHVYRLRQKIERDPSSSVSSGHSEAGRISVAVP